MADADILITPGAGAKIDTRTVGAGNDENRQVIVIGDPATAAGVAPVDPTFGLAVDVTRLIGEVAVLAVTPGVGGANLGKAEDAPHSSGDVGVFFVAVRQDVLAPSTSTDGDYAAPKVNANGALYVSVSSLPAAARTTDSIGSAPQTGVIMQGLTERVPVFAAIDVSGSGDNTLVAAQGAGNKIRVHQVFLMAASAVNVRFESGAGGTALTGQMNVSANGGFVLPFSPLGHFETGANALLNLELSTAVSVDGCLAYSVVT